VNRMGTGKTEKWTEKYTMRGSERKSDTDEEMIRMGRYMCQVEEAVQNDNGRMSASLGKLAAPSARRTTLELLLWVLI